MNMNTHEIYQRSTAVCRNDTYHLNLSIFTNSVELYLLIGQSVVQSLWGCSLDMSGFFCDALLWSRVQTAWSLVCFEKADQEYSLWNVVLSVSGQLLGDVMLIIPR